MLVIILNNEIKIKYKTKEEYLIILKIAKTFIYRNFEYNKFKRDEMIQNNIKEFISTVKHIKEEQTFIFMKASINRILKQLNSTPYIIKDERIEGREINFCTELIPRDSEQKKSVNDFLNLTYKTGTLIGSCGFGKSFSAILIMKEIKRKTVILIDEDLILKQWLKYLNKYAYGVNIGIIKGGKIKQETLDADVVIASKGTLINRIEELKQLAETTGLVIVDECHTAAADTFNNVLSYFKPKALLGLTATPKRADRKDYLIKDSVGDIFFEADRKFLIEQGSIIEPKLFLMFVIDKIKNFKRYYKLTDFIEKNQKIVEKIAKFIKKIYDSDSNNYQLCILKKISFSEIIKNELIKLGVPEEEILTLHSLTEERELELENADNGKYKIILAAKLFDKAISVNRLNILHNIFPTREFSNMQQRAGRISRSFEGKKFAYVFDYVFNHETFIDQFKTTKKNHLGEPKDDRFSAYKLCTETHNAEKMLEEIGKLRTGIINLKEFKFKNQLI